MGVTVVTGAEVEAWVETVETETHIEEDVDRGQGDSVSTDDNDDDDVIVLAAAVTMV